MAEKSKYQDIDAVDAALDKGVAASESVTDLEREVGKAGKIYNDDSEADLNIGDENGNVLVQCKNGNIKVANFDSSIVPTKFLNGKKVAFIGDSITASGSPDDQSNMYHAVFAKLSGCTVKNCGQWNTTIARGADNITETAQPFITRATEANLSGCDMVVVFGGINDWRHDKQAIGDHFATDASGNKTANTDTNCFAGAMHELINTIRSIVPLATILFMTPLQGYRTTYSDYRVNGAVNSYGDTLGDFRDAINDICAFYQVPVFNVDKLFNFDPRNEAQRTAYFADGLHPNDAGHIRLGELLYKFVYTNLVF